jgi:transcriptional regulator with PAS, ATPase and Fis domain
MFGSATSILGNCTTFKGMRGDPPERFPNEFRCRVTFGCASHRAELLFMEQVKMSRISSPCHLSSAMQHALGIARCAAASDSIVLLLGESGSGKDHLARYIHDRSKRSGGPFLTINCAAIAEQLAESELFGHTAGAFTGAVQSKRGLIERASMGTLFLNEIGEMPANLQSKLLTFLDSRSFFRVGSTAPTTSDARITVATNRDLDEEVERGSFRADFFHRLSVITIRVPALRERLEDIPILAHKFLLELTSTAAGGEPPEIFPETFRVLASYSWPANVRELRNVLERCLVLSDGLAEEMNALLVREIQKLRRSGRGPSVAVEDNRNPSIIQELLRQASGKRVRNPTRLQKERLYCECVLEMGWKQKDIAQALGVSAATVSNWTSDVRAHLEDFSVDEMSLQSSPSTVDAEEAARSYSPDSPTLRVN